MNKSTMFVPTMTPAEEAAWVEMARTKALRAALSDGRGDTYAKALADAVARRAV